MLENILEVINCDICMDICIYTLTKLFKLLFEELLKLQMVATAF